MTRKSSNETMRETSSVTTRTVLGYLRVHGGEEAVRAVVATAGLSENIGELEQAGHWVSYATRIRLFEAAVARLGDPHAMFEIGRSSVRQNVAPSVTLAMRALGSPAKIYRYLPRMASKYSTTSTMTYLGGTATSARFAFRLHDGYEHSRLDCEYCQGLLAAVPEGFGLPPARISHPECESDGAPACIYEVSWERQGRWLRRSSGELVRAELEIAALRGQLADLRSAAADLVGGDDLAHVLQRIVERAATAVLARGYLLAIRTEDSSEPPRALPRAGARRGADARRRPVGRPRSRACRRGGRRDLRTTAPRPARRRARPRAAGARGRSRCPPGLRRHAAAAVDMMTALQDSRRDAERARELLDLAHQLADADRPNAIARVVAAALPGIVGCDTAGVWLWDEDARRLRPAATTGGADSADGAAVVDDILAINPDAIPEMAQFLADPQPMVVSPSTVSPDIARVLAARGLNQVVAVPLFVEGRLHGVVAAGWRDSAPAGVQGSDLMARLQGVGQQAASALRNAALAERVRHQAEHDELTGLPNRRLFAARLDDALTGKRRDDREAIGLLFCDLDGFKEINDRYGHGAGDDLLRQVADRLSDTVRDGDQVARLSGDEFAILLPRVADVREAEAVATRIVAALAVPFDVDGREVSISASVGIALDAQRDVPGEALLRDADQAMYVAKQAGRNRVAIFPAS